MNKNKQALKLGARILENLPDMSTNLMQELIDNPVELKRFLRGLCDSLSTSQIDSIIRINRSVRPVYPDWVTEIMHPELENTGPLEYDATKLVEQLAPGQEDIVVGKKIYKYLKDNDLLSTCIGLADLIEIQKKGIDFFRQNWKDKAIFGWRSIVRFRYGNLNVPCLCEDGGEVVLVWYWVDNVWNASFPALRFASN